MDTAKTEAPADREVELHGTSTPSLMQQAVEKASRLISAEITLARQEITESVRAAVMVVVGALVALVGALAFLVMAIVTIVVAVPSHWIAALVFTVLFLACAAAGGVLALTRLKRISPLRQTTETIKEDVAWAKQQLTRETR